MVFRISQLDVKRAFLHAVLLESDNSICVRVPIISFVPSADGKLVGLVKLLKSLYGLNPARTLWY